MSFNDGGHDQVLLCSYLLPLCLYTGVRTSSSWRFKQLLCAVGTVSSDRFLSDLQLGNQKESLKFLNRSHKSSCYTALRHRNTDLWFCCPFVSLLAMRVSKKIQRVYQNKISYIHTTLFKKKKKNTRGKSAGTICHLHYYVETTPMQKPFWQHIIAYLLYSISTSWIVWYIHNLIDFFYLRVESIKLAATFSFITRNVLVSSRQTHLT